MGKRSIAKKISLILLAAVLCLALLEAGLRFTGFASGQQGKYVNNKSLKTKKECVILCLRDTANRLVKGTPWPLQVEEILNAKNIGIKFRVIDGGIDAIPSSAILYRLDKNLYQYNPDIVITMSGIHDGERSASFLDIVNTRAPSFRTYALVKLLLSNKYKTLIRKQKQAEQSKDIQNRVSLDKLQSEAEADSIQEIKMDPFNYQLYASLGHMYITQGKFEQAEEMFKKSIEIQPDNDSTYNGLGESYYSRNRFDEAEEMFEKALEINPDNVNAFLRLVNTYQEQGKFEQAEEMFKESIARNPNKEKNYIKLGVFYNNLGNYKQAEGMFKKALEISPDDTEALKSLGTLYITQGKFEEAQEALKGIQREIGYFNLGFLYNAQGKYKEAEEELKKAIDVAVYNGQAYAVLGDNYAKQGKYLQAEESLRKSITIDPVIPEQYIQLAHIYKDQAKYTQAKEELEKAIQVNPGYAEAYIQLSRCYIDEQKYKEAAEVLNKGILADSLKKENIYVELALCFSGQRLGDKLIQENLLKQAINENPECASAYLELGRLYIEQSKYQEAEEELKKAFELAPLNNSKQMLELGYCYIKQGKSEQLEDLLNKIANSKIKDDQMYSFLAVNYQRKGDSVSAEKFFKAADTLRLNYYCPQTYYNYNRLRDRLFEKNIRFVCVQYPMRSTEPLKRFFNSTKGIIFVDNEKIFKNAVRHSKYADYFEDYSGGDFGRCTPQGEKLLARNIAEVILKEVF
jgi:tetratricopeptide (TPR) repeat protein